MLALLLVSVTARVAFVLATHTFTLVNHCSYSVPVYVDNAYSSVPYVSPGVMCEMMKRLRPMFAPLYRMGRSRELLAQAPASI
jgi:hypothetical protein